MKEQDKKMADIENVYDIDVAMIFEDIRRNAKAIVENCEVFVIAPVGSSVECRKTEWKCDRCRFLKEWAVV